MTGPRVWPHHWSHSAQPAVDASEQPLVGESEGGFHQLVPYTHMMTSCSRVHSLVMRNRVVVGLSQEPKSY